jgi:hypothetical protein
VPNPASQRNGRMIEMVEIGSVAIIVNAVGETDYAFYCC